VLISELEEQNLSCDELCGETARRAIGSLQEPVRAEAAVERVKLEVEATERLGVMKQDYERDAEAERRTHIAERQGIQAERDKALSELADEREKANRQRARQIDKLCSLAVIMIEVLVFFACATMLLLRLDALIERMSEFFSGGSFTNAAIVDLCIGLVGCLSFLGSRFTKTRDCIARLVWPLVVRWYDRE